MKRNKSITEMKHRHEWRILTGDTQFYCIHCLAQVELEWNNTAEMYTGRIDEVKLI